MPPVVLFYLCMFMALLNMGSLIFLSTQGIWSWSGFCMSCFWIALATLHAHRAGTDKPQS